MSTRKGQGNVTVEVEDPRNDCSEEFIRAIERNRIEMEIAWLRSEDPAGVLESTVHTHLTLMAKCSKPGPNRKN